MDPQSEGRLDDGRKVSAELVRPLITDELAKIKAPEAVGEFDRASQIFEKMSTNVAFAEFLTLPLMRNRRSEASEPGRGPGSIDRSRAVYFHILRLGWLSETATCTKMGLDTQPA